MGRPASILPGNPTEGDEGGKENDGERAQPSNQNPENDHRPSARTQNACCAEAAVRPSPTRPPEVASAYFASLLFIVIAFLTFYFVLELTIQLTINNVVIVSGGQGRDPAMHKPVSTLPQIPLPSRLPHNIEQSSLCCSGGPCWLSI